MTATFSEPGWERPWHRLLAIGRHRRDDRVIVLNGPPLVACLDCSWIGVNLGAYARYLGALMVPDDPVADKWIWLPRRVWQRALDEIW